MMYIQFNSIQFNSLQSTVFIPHGAITLRWAREENNKTTMNNKLRQGYKHAVRKTATKNIWLYNTL